MSDIKPNAKVISFAESKARLKKDDSRGAYNQRVMSENLNSYNPALAKDLAASDLAAAEAEFGSKPGERFIQAVVFIAGVVLLLGAYLGVLFYATSKLTDSIRGHLGASESSYGERLSHHHQKPRHSPALGALGQGSISLPAPVPGLLPEPPSHGISQPLPHK